MSRQWACDVVVAGGGARWRLRHVHLQERDVLYCDAARERNVSRSMTVQKEHDIRSVEMQNEYVLLYLL